MLRHADDNELKQISATHTVNMIKTLNALVKVISVRYDSDRCLNYILDQLADPKTNRPIKALDNVHRHRVFVPSKGEWIYREVEDVKRGATKNTIFTKKTSVTLLPADGKTQLYVPKNGYPIGLIFDANKSHLKNEKYIFIKNVNTDSKWWIKKKGILESQQAVIKGISLDALKNHLMRERSNETLPECNEILAGLSRSGLIGIFTSVNTLDDRLRVCYTHQKIKDKLKMELPLFIINANEGIVVYDETWQLHDIRSASRWDFFNLSIEFIDKLKPNKDKKEVQPIVKQGFDKRDWNFLYESTLPKLPSYESLKYPITAITQKKWNSYSESWDPIQKDEIIFCPILVAALNKKSEILKMILTRYPDELIAALANLKKLYHLPAVYEVAGDNIEIQMRYEKYKHNLHEAYALLLLQLSDRHQHKYSVSHKEKRLLESCLISEIDKLQSAVEVQSFWDTHKDGVALNQRRHTMFDSFLLNSSLSTRIKANVYKKVQEKINKFEDRFVRKVLSVN